MTLELYNKIYISNMTSQISSSSHNQYIFNNEEFLFNAKNLKMYEHFLVFPNI